MPAPSPSFIVDDPAPLNPSTFPFAVQPFPAQDFRDINAIIPARAKPGSKEPQPDAAHRYEA